MAERTASPGAPTTQTTRLLACGILAGPLFLAAWWLQAFTREGFDPRRHPLSWHGVLHQVGFVVAVASWTAACFVLVRRFVALRQRGWVAACVATPLVVLVLASWPDPDGLSLRLVLATAIQFGFVAAVAARLMGGLPDAAAASPVARRARRLKRAA